MNLEDFFISEYEKLKDENEKLKSQVAELSKPKGAAGLLDARVVSTEVEAVKVNSASSYMLREYIFKGKPSSYIEEKKADIDNADKWRAGGYVVEEAKRELLDMMDDAIKRRKEEEAKEAAE